MPTDSGVLSDRGSPHRKVRSLGRPSISPLVWVAAAAWAASRAGTELALWGWVSSDAGPVILGAAAMAALGFVTLRSKRSLVRWSAGAAACAMCVSVAHGVWLGSTASALDAAGPRSWTGTVAADVRASAFGNDVIVRLDGVAGAPAVRVSWPAGSDLPDYGQRVELDARLSSAARLGAGAAEAFRAGEILSASPWHVRVSGWPGGPLGLVYAWRADSITALRSDGGRGGDALASMLFGVPPQGDGVVALEDARTSGVAWALTASGLHLGVIILLAERLAGILGAGRKGRATAALVALAVLAAAAGMRLSLLRAALAAAAAVLARLAGRRRDTTAALGCAVAILVIADPAAVYDAGLTLGVAAVSGFALLSGLVRAWLAPLFGRGASRALAGSVAAQAAVAPLAAGMFGAVSLIGPITLALSGVPVQVAVALGACGAALAPVSRQLGLVVLRGGSVAADLATRVWQVAARVPGALLAVPAPPAWFVVAWIATGALLWLRWPVPRRALRVRFAAAAIVLALVSVSSPAAPVSGCVAVLNVGQGDSILIRDGGQAVLVDTGPDPVVLRQALARAGVHSLDGLVLTHAHEDHIGGLDGLAGVARPGWIGLPDVRDEAVDGLAARVAVDTDEVVRLRQGMEFDVGRIKVRVLWPRGGDTGLTANDTSVVLLLDKDGHRALLLGDAEAQAQTGALEAWSGPVEMMKVAHHGSTNGLVPQALETWRPAIALISVGAGNAFGHPKAETLAALAGIGARVRRTDLEGDLGWEPEAASPALAAGPSGALCDNRRRGRPLAGIPTSRGQVDAWQPQVSPISSRSTSSTARRSCCSNAPRSVSTTGSGPSPTWISTMRRSTGPRPPPTTWSTRRTRCRS